MGKKIKQALAEWYRDLGSDQLYCELPQDRRKAAASSDSRAQVKVTPERKSSGRLNTEMPIDIRKPANITKYESESRLVADGCATLEQLREAVHAFEGCSIKAMAANTVFSDGNPQANVMLIGEAPGANEDKQGIPFCGQSGKLLDNIIAAIGLSRDTAYITNTIFWRPPGNRRPTPEEIALCRPFVEKHIALVRPKLIILVGSTAVESLLDSKVAMHDLRHEYYEYNNRYLSSPIKTAVIFHPSYLLRQPLKKKEMWLDIQNIKYNILDANH